MSSKQRPPLTPADANYLGLATIAGAEAAPVEARHLLRWPSRSRPGKEHHSSCDERGGDVRCTCEAWTYRSACGHAAGHLDALAHHGVAFGPPPADPGGAGRIFAPCARCPDHRGCARDGCRLFRRRDPGFATPLDPDDEGPFAGGAALDAAQAALDGEQADWETIEMSPEHAGGFWTATPSGPMHVSGDPHMSDETLGALRELAELAVRQHLDPTPPALDAAVPPYPSPLPTLDEAVALGGNRWIRSRTAAGVRLVCASCGAVRGWATEVGAINWLATDGLCSCGGAGPTPPARRAARRPMNDLLADLGV
jgi:hypothetical protein